MLYVAMTGSIQKNHGLCLVSSSGQTVQVWDPSSTAILRHEFQPQAAFQVSCVDVDNTGSILSLGGQSKQLQVRTTFGGAISDVPDINTLGPTSALCFSRCSKYIVTGRTDGQLQRYSLETPADSKAYLPGHNAGATVTGFSQSPIDSYKLASVSTGGTLLIHHFMSGRKTDTINDPKNQALRAVCFSPHNRQEIVAAGDLGIIRLWTLPTKVDYLWQNRSGERISAVVFDSRNENLIVAASFDKTLSLIDKRANKIQQIIFVGRPVHSVAVHDGQSELAVGDSGGGIHVYDPRSGAASLQFQATQMDGTSVAEPIRSVFWRPAPQTSACNAIEDAQLSLEFLLSRNRATADAEGTSRLDLWRSQKARPLSGTSGPGGKLGKSAHKTFRKPLVKEASPVARDDSPPLAVPSLLLDSSSEEPMAQPCVQEQVQAALMSHGGNSSLLTGADVLDQATSSLVEKPTAGKALGSRSWGRKKAVGFSRLSLLNSGDGQAAASGCEGESLGEARQLNLSEEPMQGLQHKGKTQDVKENINPALKGSLGEAPEIESELRLYNQNDVVEEDMFGNLSPSSRRCGESGSLAGRGYVPPTSNSAESGSWTAIGSDLETNEVLLAALKRRPHTGKLAGPGPAIMGAVCTALQRASPEANHSGSSSPMERVYSPVPFGESSKANIPIEAQDVAASTTKKRLTPRRLGKSPRSRAAPLLPSLADLHKSKKAASKGRSPGKKYTAGLNQTPSSATGLAGALHQAVALTAVHLALAGPSSRREPDEDVAEIPVLHGSHQAAGSCVALECAAASQDGRARSAAVAAACRRDQFEDTATKPTNIEDSFLPAEGGRSNQSPANPSAIEERMEAVVGNEEECPLAGNLSIDLSSTFLFQPEIKATAPQSRPYLRTNKLSWETSFTPAVEEIAAAEFSKDPEAAHQGPLHAPYNASQAGFSAAAMHHSIGVGLRTATEEEGPAQVAGRHQSSLALAGDETAPELLGSHLQTVSESISRLQNSHSLDLKCLHKDLINLHFKVSEEVSEVREQTRSNQDSISFRMDKFELMLERMNQGLMQALEKVDKRVQLLETNQHVLDCNVKFVSGQLKNMYYR